MDTMQSLFTVFFDFLLNTCEIPDRNVLMEQIRQGFVQVRQDVILQDIFEKLSCHIMLSVVY